MKKFIANLTVTETYHMVIEAETEEEAKVKADELYEKTQDPMFYYLEYRDENPNWEGGNTEIDLENVTELK